MMKLAVVIPIPVEFNAAKEVLFLTEGQLCAGCRTAMLKYDEIELRAILSGPGKARAAQATSSLIHQFYPDLILDTGTCAGIDPESSIGRIIIAKKCFEFDIGGRGIPNKKVKEMELVSAFHFLPIDAQEGMLSSALGAAARQKFDVVAGFQAAGEFVIDSLGLRNALFELFHVEGSNWETAGVFVSALRSAVPALSFRVISDLGDRNALADFRSNARFCASGLYQYLKILLDAAWFHQFIDEWKKVPDSVRSKMFRSVRPA